ncbi:MAG: SDR family oxidoreductase [Acidobacteria bacterium]|nr:SDR family oxidoreductase [Acidobacteriota bacterium]
MRRFDGTVALVSGGARGMGASHVRALVDEGAKVVFGDILDDEGKKLEEELGESAYYVHLDVTKNDDWKHAVAGAEKEYGPIGLLVNNAGIVSYGPVEVMEPDEFRRVIDINLTGTFLGMHYVVPSLRKAGGGGAIINISSTAGLMGYASLAAYSASKWGVRGMTKSVALELGKDGIRVMSIHPGPIRTPMTEGFGDEIAAGQPIPRFGASDEVTKMMMFMAADATYSTGSEWVIDGGAVLGPVIELPEE